MTRLFISRPLGSERPISRAYRDGHLWADSEIIAASEYSNAEIKSFMLSYPGIAEVYTGEEILARQRELFPELDPESLPEFYPAGGSSWRASRRQSPPPTLWLGRDDQKRASSPPAGIDGSGRAAGR